MTFLGRALLLVAVFAVVVPFLQPMFQYTEMPERPFGRTPGEERAEFGFSLGSSIKGQSRAEDVKAVLEVLGDEMDPETAEPLRTYAELPFEVISNSEWEDYIQVSESETYRPMSLRLRFDALPDEDELWGKPFRIVVSGDVTYPVKVSAAPENANTRRGEFSDETKSFEEAVLLHFRDRAAHEQYERDWAAFEEATDREQQGLLSPVRDAMTYGFHPELLRLICWGGAAACAIAGWRLLIVARRRRTAADALT